MIAISKTYSMTISYLGDQPRDWEQLCADAKRRCPETAVIGDVLVTRHANCISPMTNSVVVYHQDGNGFRVLVVDGVIVTGEIGANVNWAISPRVTKTRRLADRLLEFVRSPFLGRTRKKAVNDVG
jgi:hypothetical protein